MGWYNCEDRRNNERYKIFVGKTLEEIPNVTIEKGIEDNINVDFADINCEDESLMTFCLRTCGRC